MAGIVFRTSAASVRIEKTDIGRVVVRAASPAKVVVVSVGRQGPPGPQGPPGESVEDPGDLTLFFKKALV